MNIQGKDVCAVIVTYHPDETFWERIKVLVTGQVNEIIIVDNNSGEETINRLKKLEEYDNILVRCNLENVGIAAALNVGLNEALRKGYSWALTLDQDTTPQLDMVEILTEILQVTGVGQTAVIGSNYIDDNSGLAKLSEEKAIEQKFLERKTVITSGSLMSLEIFEKISHFKEEFFIDAVDHEYCLRARSNGYKIYISTKVLMRHPIGHSKAHYFLGLSFFKVPVLHHAAFRWYFISRNAYISVLSYLFQDPFWAIPRLIRLWGLFAIMLLYEKDKMKKLQWIILGTLDGIFFNTTRKIPIPRNS